MINFILCCFTMCFTMIFLMFNNINYFMFSYPIKVSSTQKTTMQFNWKW